MIQLEYHAWKKMHAADSDERVAFGLSFKQFLSVQKTLQNCDRKRAWRILEFLLSRNPCMSEAGTAALVGNSSNFDFITKPLDNALNEPSPEREDSLSTLEKKYERWVTHDASPPLPFPIDTGFFTRIYWGHTCDISEDVRRLFAYAPMSFLVYKWQLLRDTSCYASTNGYLAALQQIMDANSSPYVLSCMVNGMHRAGVMIPEKYSHFLHLQLTLKRGDESMPLYDHLSTGKSATITAIGMWLEPRLDEFADDGFADDGFADDEFSDDEVADDEGFEGLVCKGNPL
ncbi:hypothetical protein BJX63DRAFT_437374 [Aspergillus granulosus]|uniref:Uncharacterized protein n=1 Tax=Aspergillus granulosus TaxID=176169 RepID=A0ABR4GWQ1_9EURO